MQIGYAYAYPICITDMQIGLAYQIDISNVSMGSACPICTSDMHIGYALPTDICIQAYQKCTSDLHVGDACRADTHVGYAHPIYMLHMPIGDAPICISDCYAYEICIQANIAWSSFVSCVRQHVHET